MTTPSFHRSVATWALVLTGALASAAIVGTAEAGEVSVSKPVGQLFAPNASQLSPAGERWLRSQVAPSAKAADHMVVVQIPGTPALQAQRASVIRHRLGALGVASQQIYIEAAPLDAESTSSRVAAL